MTDAPPTVEPSIIDFLRERLQLAEAWLGKPEIPLGNMAMWNGSVRSRLERIYGTDSPLLKDLPQRGIDRNIADRHAELAKRVEVVRRIIWALETAPGAANSTHASSNHSARIKFITGSSADMTRTESCVFSREQRSMTGVTVAARSTEAIWIINSA